MNKKVLTLCAGFLLAGGLTVPAFAETFEEVAKDAANLENQYYRVRVQEGDGITDKSGWLDADSKDGWSNDADNSTLWTVKKVPGQNGTYGFQLISVLTGEPLSVTVTNADDTKVTYDTFNGDQYALWFENGKGYNGTETAVTSIANGNGGVWWYSLDEVDPVSLTANKLNELLGYGFGLQICQQVIKDGKVDTTKDPVEYSDLKGNVFTGVLFAKAGSNGVTLYQGDENGKQIVLTSEKWGSQAGGTSETGYIFKALTQSQIKELGEKVLATEFTISQPSTVAGEPLEVAVTVKDTKYELVVSIVENVARLTVAESTTDKVADFTYASTADGVTHNTYVKFGLSNAVDYSDFYGKLWNITRVKDGYVASPNCTGDDFIPAAQVALNYPEGQWLYNAELGVFVNRESGKQLKINGLRYVQDKENTYTDGIATYTITSAGDPSDNYNDGYLAGYTTDQLKQKAFFIGTPIAATQDTVWLSKAANGKLEFVEDKAKAVEFRLTMADFDGDNFDADSYLTAKTLTPYTVWKDKNAGTTEEKTDVVNFHQYYVREAVTGDWLNFDSQNKRFELAEKVTNWTPKVVIKHKNINTYNLLYNVYTRFTDTNNDKKNDTYITVNDAISENEAWHKSFCKALKLYGAHSANELVQSENAYDFTQNDMFVIVDADAQMYRGDFSNTGVLDTIKIFRNDDNSYVLYEKGALLTAEDGKTAIEGFLGMENINDPKYADMHAAMLADTAFYSNTFRPQYMLAVDAEIVNDGWTCPLNPEHNTQAWREENGGHCADAVKDRPYIQGRYLVNLVDSAKAAKEAEIKLADNKFIHEYYKESNGTITPYYRLGFVQAKHIGDSLIIASTNDTIDLKNNPIDKVCTFAFRYVDAERDAFTIETLYDYTTADDDEKEIKDRTRGYIKYQNGIPVVTPKASEAWVFDLNETSETPTANETIESAADATISVVAVDGAVIVKGAEGKNVIVSTILGKVVANEVLNSDNETIAAPAGIVVVSVDGESFKVAVK